MTLFKRHNTATLSYPYINYLANEFQTASNAISCMFTYLPYLETRRTLDTHTGPDWIVFEIVAGIHERAATNPKHGNVITFRDELAAFVARKSSESA